MVTLMQGSTVSRTKAYCVDAIPGFFTHDIFSLLVRGLFSSLEEELGSLLVHNFKENSEASADVMIEALAKEIESIRASKLDRSKAHLWVPEAPSRATLCSTASQRTLR